ncbi:MAG: sigma-54-dependent transcriptional regulator [Vicinamibacterales bacterium]
MADILVVDDDQAVASAFERFLRHEGHVCRVASSAEDAEREMAAHDPDLVVMDIRMPGVDGLEALARLRSRFPQVDVVMMTAYGTSQTSIDAIRAGAFDYLTKPLDLDQLRTVIGQALTARAGRNHVEVTEGGAGEPAVSLVGETPSMLAVYKMIGRLSVNDVPALVLGERGTGRQLVVRTIHDNSDRRHLPFVSLDCASSPEAAIATELFGQGAGTVHLASVHALPVALQQRLALALEHARAGGYGPKLHARVLASTDHDLAGEVQAGRWNRALFEALSLITLQLAPLRDRRDDIPVLVRHFIYRFNEELNRTIRGVDEQVLRKLRDHAWPGNVGELESVIKRASIVTRSDVITLEDVGDVLAGSRFSGRLDAESALCRAARLSLQERLVESSRSADASVFHDIVDLVEATLVKEALAITNGNQVKAAEVLGVNRATLRKKIVSEN